MDIEKETIIKEIQSIFSELDLKDLLFLKEQASVLSYNKKVREKNSIDHNNNEKPGRKQKKTGKSKIDKKPEVRIEPLKNGKYFNLCIGDAKIFMDLKEIKAIYLIAKAAENPSVGAIRLYNWFKKERSDVLVEGFISSKSHPSLLLIYRELLETFSGG